MTELPADMEARTPAPEGEAWRTVPVEPTEAMLVNGREALMPLVRLDSYGPLIGVWEDMLAASPVVPVGVSREEIARIVEGACLDYQRGHTGKVATRPERRARAVLDAADAILAALGTKGAEHDCPVCHGLGELKIDDLASRRCPRCDGTKPTDTGREA